MGKSKNILISHFTKPTSRSVNLAKNCNACGIHDLKEEKKGETNQSVLRVVSYAYMYTTYLEEKKRKKMKQSVYNKYTKTLACAPGLFTQGAEDK